MASVTGFDPANSGQEPVNSDGNKVPVGFGVTPIPG